MGRLDGALRRGRRGGGEHRRKRPRWQAAPTAPKRLRATKSGPGHASSSGRARPLRFRQAAAAVTTCSACQAARLRPGLPAAAGFAPIAAQTRRPATIAIAGGLWFLSGCDPLHKFQTVKSAPCRACAADVHEPGAAMPHGGGMERRRMGFWRDRIIGRPSTIGLATLSAWTAGAVAEDLPPTGQPHPWQIDFQPPATPVDGVDPKLPQMVLVIITVVTLFVAGAACSSSSCASTRKANPVPSKLTHNTLLEVAWTVLPVVDPRRHRHPLLPPAVPPAGDSARPT